MELYRQALQRRHLRATEPRKKVFLALTDAKKPLSMAAIMTICEPIDRVTLYRTLAVFVEVGIVRIVPVGWKRLYELTESFTPHHHHMMCTQCGSVIDIMSPEIETYIARVVADAAFMELSHTIEIQGLCSRCRP